MCVFTAVQDAIGVVNLRVIMYQQFRQCVIDVCELVHWQRSMLKSSLDCQRLGLSP